MNAPSLPPSQPGLRVAHGLVLVMATLACGHTLSQPAPSVTEADLERARRSQPVITERDIEQARRKHTVPFEEGAAQPRRPSTPQVDALPQPLTGAPLDLDAIAKGFEPIPQAPGLAAPAPTLLIFISFSMPNPTLSRLVDQASKAGATLVLRGLVDASMRATAARLQQLIGNRKVAVQLDPLAFDRYAIELTPSFVLTRAPAPAGGPPHAPSPPCEAGRCPTVEQYARAAGDVSLDFALAHVARTAPAFAKDAGVFLKRLRAVEQAKGVR